MRVCYIAGPFRAADAFGIAENVRRAERVALEVWKLGAVALTPHLNTANFDRTLPDEVFLRGDLELLDRCDALITVPGWEQSRGTTTEVAHAITQAIPVFHDLATLAAWLASHQSADATGQP